MNPTSSSAAKVKPAPAGKGKAAAPKPPGSQQSHHGAKSPATAPSSQSRPVHESKDSGAKQNTGGKNKPSTSKSGLNKDTQVDVNTSSVNDNGASDSNSNSASGSTSTQQAFDARLCKLESMIGRMIASLPNRSEPEQSELEYDNFLPPMGEADQYEDMDYEYDYPPCTQPRDDVAPLAGSSGKPQAMTTAPDTDNDTTDTAIPALAMKFAAQADVGSPLNDDIASSTSYMINHKLEDKTLEETTVKYLPPSNCPFLDAPKVNPVIWDNLAPSTRSRDLKLARVQKLLTRGLTAFAHTMSPSDMTENQQDALALLASANFELNALRKELIKPEMNQAYSHLCKPSAQVTKFLFGDDLGQRVKNLKDEQKAALGVVKSDHGRSRSRTHPGPAYHPYKSAETTRSRYYRSAGWFSSSSNRPSPGTSQRPFLDRNRPPRGRRPVQGQRQPAASQGRYQPPQRK